MTEHVDNVEHADNVVHAEHADRVDNIAIRPDRATYTVRILFAAAAFMAAVSVAILAVSFAISLTRLTQDTANEKAQDACYDAYTAQITEGNAAVLTAIGDLVVILPTQPRDQLAIDGVIARIGAAGDQYDAAINARHAWVNDGKPIPCPLTPD